MHRHIIKCNIIDALFQILQVKPRQKTQKEASRKKKRETEFMHPAHSRESTHMCLSLNLILPRSVPCCRTRHTTSHTHLCVKVFLVSHEKKRLETLATSRQIKEKKLPSFAQQKKRRKNYQNNNKSCLKKYNKEQSNVNVPVYTAAC